MNCSEITKGLIAAECNKSASAGVEDDVILINYDDIDKAASTITENVINELVLKNGKRGFVFTSIGRSMNDTGVSLTVGTYRNTLIHTAMLRIFTKNEDAKKFVNQFIAGARVVAVFKNKEIGNDGDVKYEAYGWDNGLEISALTNTAAMADTIVYDLQLASTDAAQEGSLPKSVFDTDLTTTEVMLASLTA